MPSDHILNTTAEIRQAAPTTSSDTGEPIEAAETVLEAGIRAALHPADWRASADAVRLGYTATHTVYLDGLREIDPRHVVVVDGKRYRVQAPSRRPGGGRMGLTCAPVIEVRG